MINEPIPDPWAVKLFASGICIILCGFFGAIGIEVFKFTHSFGFDNFWQSFLTIVLVAVTVMLFLAAICCLISAVGIWMPGSKGL